MITVMTHEQREAKCSVRLMLIQMTGEEKKKRQVVRQRQPLDNHRERKEIEH